ncbi:hypothetical protein D082_31280 [Synechocystis sp. PCC 6714]|nr:hypothetical protein D082_31280 [Synechocystis sp. PCC 6714]
MEVYYPDGQKFLTTVELNQAMAKEKRRANEEQQRADRLTAKLKKLGVNPEAI